jgi:hypothetical protein
LVIFFISDGWFIALGASLAQVCVVSQVAANVRNDSCHFCVVLGFCSVL